MQVCKSCKFFAMRKRGDAVGECRKRALAGFVVTTQFGIRFQGAWPPVEEASGCGEGEPLGKDTRHVDDDYSEKERSKLHIA
jgi:hypothetical protein